MKIESAVFSEGQLIPDKYTCEGDNINPPLKFLDIPEGTKTLALIMDDPDVPRDLRADGMFVHWVVWNMSADSLGIGEGESPAGIEGANTRGERKYTGPCPPDREHRYFFKLYALDVELDIDNNSGKQELLIAMDRHVLEMAELMGRYDKKARRGD